MCRIIIDNEEILPRPLYIQAGPNKAVLLKYIKNAKIVEFCDNKTFEENLKKSDIVICHAGVGVINLSISQNKYPAVFARSKECNEHVDNHQLDYANFFKENKSFSYIRDSKDLAKFIHKKEYLNKPGGTLNSLYNLRVDLMFFLNNV